MRGEKDKDKVRQERDRVDLLFSPARVELAHENILPCEKIISRRNAFGNAWSENIEFYFDTYISYIIDSHVYLDPSRLPKIQFFFQLCV